MLGVGKQMYLFRRDGDEKRKLCPLKLLGFKQLG
jgi:hypothetical protein